MQAIKKIKRRLLENLIKLSEFPLECAAEIPIVELKGNSEVYVSGCIKIIEYSQGRIIFDAGQYPLTIIGENMHLGEFASGSICISGTIECISLTRG